MGSEKVAYEVQDGGVVQRVRWAMLPALLMASALFSACTGGNGNGGGDEPGNGDGSRDQPHVAGGPEPAAMCQDGEAPVVAAYEIDTGRYRWVACSDQTEWGSVQAAADDRVYVEVGRVVLGFDTKNGKEVWRGSRAEYRRQVPDDADIATEEPPIVEGVRLTGGQDDPLVAFVDDTGEQIWSQPTARLVYDDVWAVGDGAVFAVDRHDPIEGATPAAGQTHVVAYELESGEVRWERQTGGYLWPWHVRSDRLFALWDNLQVIDAGDGRTIWATAYAATESGFPRMTGAVANDDLVFVSFTVVRSGGD